MVDNEDENHVTVSGDWTKDNKGGYGPSLLRIVADKNSATQSVTFSPTLLTKGAYEVFVYSPRVENASPDITIVVHSGKKSKATKLHPGSMKIEGQTSGEWISLGQYSFNNKEKNEVEITTQGASGVVVADAVLFIPK
jgi:hypothetical protein